MKRIGLELSKKDFTTLLSCVSYSMCKTNMTIDEISGQISEFIRETTDEDFPDEKEYFQRLVNQLQDMIVIREKQHVLFHKLNNFIESIDDIE